MAEKSISSDPQGGSLKEGESIFAANAQGHGFQLIWYDGVFHFTLPEEALNGQKQVDKLKKLKDVELKDDDIIICSYPKCGSHWLWEALEMLRGGVIQYKKEIKETRMMEAIFKEGIDGIPSPRILNTHLPLHMLPKQVLEKKIKCIQIMRNPKDVCVSFFHHASNEMPPTGYEGDFTEFTEAYLAGKVPCGSYHQYIHDWKNEVAEMKDLAVFEMYYEEMKKDPVKNIREVADFIGVNVTDKFCQDVAEACSFKKLKKADTEIKENFLNLWKEGSDGTFFRKGEVGDWKNWFTVAENERFDQIWNAKMKDSGISFTYSLK